MTDWGIDWDTVDWASAGAYVLAGVLAIITLTALVSTAARALIRTARGARGHGPVILAGLVALLGSAMSIQAQWGFLGHNLGIEDTWAKAAFVGVFDLAAVSAALLSREARVRNPGTFGTDALIVWAVALLLGWLGSTEASTFEGQAARWAVPLVAALMWDRVIQRDVARAVALDRARMATVTGRISAGVIASARAVARSVTRTLARLGLVQPDQDIATIQQARWRRRFIAAASRAAAAKRRHGTDGKSRKRLDRAEEQFAAVVAAGQRLGAVTSPSDLERLLWEAQVVLNAADALDHAGDESPWRTAGRDTGTSGVPSRRDIPSPPKTSRPAPRPVPVRDARAEAVPPRDDRPPVPVETPADPVPSPVPVVSGRPAPSGGTLDAAAKTDRDRQIFAALDERGTPGSRWQTQADIARGFGLSTSQMSRIAQRHAKLTKVNGS